MAAVSSLIVISLLLPARSPHQTDEALQATTTAVGRSPAATDCIILAGRSVPRADAAEGSHFAVYTLARTSGDETTRLQQVLDHTHGVFYEAMGRAGFDLKPPSEPLVWLVFADRQEYDRYVWQTERLGVPQLDGYYSPRTNRVAVMFGRPNCPAGETTKVRWTVAPAGGAAPLESPNGYVGEWPTGSPGREAHEAAHQLAFNSGLQKRGVMYPFWVAEGLATSFETNSRSGPAAINAIRCRHLLSARRRGSLQPLRTFLVQVQVSMENTRDAQECYGQAWGVFHYLFTQHPTRLRLYLQKLADTTPGRRPLHVREKHVADSLGPLDELETGWQVLLDRLEEATESTGTIVVEAPPAKSPALLADANMAAAK